ncbi:MAG: CotH kinase family protein [Deltaproteobacteria bacterium]|nr:CotH kinase family protein [Deltaproteobacteria bacterium]
MACLSACGAAAPEGSPQGPNAPPPVTGSADTLPPRMLSASPAAGAVEVPVTAELSVVFDEGLDAATTRLRGLRLFRGGAEVMGQIVPSPEGVAFLPLETLEYGSEYEAVVDGGVSDLAGNPLGSEVRWRFRTETFSSDLPLVFLDPLGETIPDEPKIPARLRLEDGAGRVDYEGWAGVEIRGHSSINAAKKQYGFETWDEAQDEVEVELLGMPEESDWILQGNYFDASLLRNYFALELSRATGRYAPRLRFAELFLAVAPGDLRYWGVYAVMEKIKRDANRVSLKKLEPDDNAEPEVTGGYLLAMDKLNPGDFYFDTARGTRLLYEYPKGEDITADQAAWIQGYIEDFEAALEGPNFRDPALGYRAYLDLESAVDFFLVHELLKNVDAFAFSTFMSKERGEKLSLGPVWDFDLAMGNLLSGGLGAPEGWQLCAGRWIGRLLEDPDFVAAVANRYRALRVGTWSDAAVAAILDEAAEALREAGGRNAQRWYRREDFTFESRGAELRAWLEARLGWVDSHIENLCLP